MYKALALLIISSMICLSNATDAQSQSIEQIMNKVTPKDKLVLEQMQQQVVYSGPKKLDQNKLMDPYF